jgi:hypothetical protein
VLGHVFNPVSFWLPSPDGRRPDLRVIAEVTTYGIDSYLCHHP